jgi:hypothetical protein
MVVEIQEEQDLKVGLPKVLFESEDLIIGFDVSPDGQQFALVREDVIGSAQIHVILNWFEELKRMFRILAAKVNVSVLLLLGDKAELCPTLTVHFFEKFLNQQVTLQLTFCNDPSTASQPSRR